jgi:hypothetical protein
MRYLKVFIVVFLALAAVVFVIENIEVLEHPVQLVLNLYIVKLETALMPLWVLILLSFGLGAILILIYFVFDHVKQRQIIRQLQQNIEILTEELKRAGVAVATSSASLKTTPPPDQSQEQTEE